MKLRKLGLTHSCLLLCMWWHECWVRALQVQRTAEIRSGLSWARIAHLLGTLKAVRYVAERQTIVQRTKLGPELAGLLKTLGISAPKQVMARKWGKSPGTQVQHTLD